MLEQSTAEDAPLVRVEDLTVHFPIARSLFDGDRERVIHAVDGVSFEIGRGQTLGLVGESGSGKTTTGRALLLQTRPTAGRVFFKGEDVTDVSGKRLRGLRKHMQLVFQDPYASLNPRMKVIDIVSEPLVVHGVVKNSRDAYERVRDLLDLCGLPKNAVDRYPHAFSGGQRQRIGIARALALKPELIVADEPVSALDVSIRAQIVNLMQDLQDELGLSYLFIAHDLAVVRHISHVVAIMYGGRIVEIANRDDIYERPKHPYTEALLSAVPVAEEGTRKGGRRNTLRGEIFNPAEPPPGCRFHTRCPIAEERCKDQDPPLEDTGDGGRAACWLR
jgi:peptide/nickel transport system ATP-binding protein